MIYIMLMVAGMNLRAGATVTVTSASATICTNSAATGSVPMWTTLGTMSILEGVNSDMGATSHWSTTLVLDAPTGWELNTAVSPTLAYTASKNITSITIGAFTSSSITIDIAGNGKNKVDEMTISGLQVRPATSSAVAGDIVPSSISGTAMNGLTTSSNFGTLSPSAPTSGSVGVTISGTPSGAVCLGTSVSFTAAVTNGGASAAYQWELNGSAISGETSSTYTSSSLANGNTIACSVISSSCITTPTATSATITMTVNPMPDAISGSSSVCTGSSVTYTDVTGGGTWSSSVLSIASVNAATGVVTGVTPGTAIITYSNALGCDATKTITVNATPEAIGGTAATCLGATTTLSDATVGGAWGSSNDAVASISATGVVSGVAVGNATVTYVLSTGCLATIPVTVNALPDAIGGTAAVCEGATTTLSDAGGGSWASSNGNVTIGSTSGVVTGVTAGTSTITYTLSTGCASTTVVTVNALPAAIGGTASVCQGATTSLSNTSAGGTWTSSNTAVATIDAAGMVNGVLAGTSLITYTLPTGCATSAVVTVNVSADAITGTVSVCEGATSTLANAVTGGTWSSSNIAVAGIDTYAGVVNGVAAGAATITYAIPAGCPAFRTVTVNAMPAAITGASTVCEGSNVTLSNTVAGGAWSSSMSGVATVDAAGVVTGAGSGIANITYAMPEGCQVTYPVTVNGLPMPILGDNLLCMGVATLYYADSTPGGTWSTANASVATIASTGGLTGVATGATTISYTTPAGCFVTTPVTVTALVAPITGDATVCVGSTATLSNPMPGGVWSSKIPAWAPVDSAIGVVTGVTASTVPVTYSLGSSCYSVIAVTVNPLPGSIGGVAAMCAGGTTSLSNPTTGGVWSSSDATIATTSVLSSTWATINGVAAGAATITYTLPTGCGRTKDVTVNPVAPIAGSSIICMGESLTLTNAVAGGTWTSSAPSWASIGYTTGVITGLTGGAATITYYLPTGCKSFLPVTISRTAAITGTTVMCEGGAVTLANSITGGVWSSSDASVAAVAGTTSVITGVSAGTAAITYTTTAGCNKIVTVTVKASPDAIAGLGAVCAGTTTTLTNTVAGGSWSSSTPTIATIGAASGVVTGIACNHTVTISYSLPSGCRTMKVVSVTATPATIGGAAVICQGSTSTYTNTLAGGSWSSSDETVATISSTGVVTAVASGTAMITYAMPTGCMTTKAITVNPISAITGDDAVCVGSTATVSDATAGGTWVSRVYTRGSITTDGVITGLAAGTTIITYSMPSGCKVTKVVTVNTLPTVSGTAVACVGLNTTMTASIAGGAWSSSNTAIATVDATGVVTGATPGTATITYTLPTGCFSTKVATINAYPSAIGGAETVCMGSTITLNNAVSGGTWSTTMAAMANISTAGVVTGVAAGTTNISYTTGAGCVVGKTITVNPIAAITGTTSACLGMTTTLACATTGGTWSSSNASIAPVGATGIVSGASAGTAVISYSIPSGCVRTTIVSVNPAATAITGATVMCAGFPSTLAGNVGGGTWTSSNIAIASVGATTGVVSGVAGGTAVITYTSGLNCRISAMITVNASAAITGTLKVCAGSTTTLANTTTGGVWSSSNPSIATVGAATGVVSGLTAGTTTITYSPATGCGRTATVTVNPLPGAISGSLNACIGSTSLVTNSTPGGVSFTSSNPSIASVGATSGVVTGVAEGTATITYTINTGCTSTATFTVNPLPAPIDGPSSACVGSTTTLSSTSEGGTWLSSNIGRASIGVTSGVVAGITPGTFNVTYTLPTGCKVAATITVNATSAITGITTVVTGGMTTLSNATTGGAWSTSDIYTATVDATTGVVSGVTDGTATITYTTAMGCPRTTIVTVNTAAGRAAETATAADVIQIDVYPNPTNGAFAIKTVNAGVLSVFGIDGKEAGRYTIAEGVNAVQLAQGLVPGIYMCKFTDVNNNATIVRLVYQP